MDTVDVGVVRHRRRHPSMEPRLLSHGYRRAAVKSSRSGVSLQWSHGLSAMDTEAVVWDEDAEPVVTGETEQQRAGNFARKF